MVLHLIYAVLNRSTCHNILQLLDVLAFWRDSAATLSPPQCPQHDVDEEQEILTSNIHRIDIIINNLLLM